MKITWIGIKDDVLGNVEFTTDKGQTVVLTKEEIKVLHDASTCAIEENKKTLP